MKKQMTYSEAQELVRNLYFNSIFPQNFLENVDADSIVSENGLCEEDAEEIEYALLEIRDNAFLKDYSYDECTPLFEKGHLTAFGRVYRHGDSFFYAIVDTQEQDFEEIFTSESDASDFIRNQLEAL